MKINIEYILNFYDTKMGAQEVGQHAGAVKGVAGEELGVMLLLDFMSEVLKWQPKLILTTECWPYSRTGVFPSGENIATPCAPTKKKNGSGKRLDAWILAKRKGEEMLFQVEVKSWSMHGYGPKDPELSAQSLPSEQEKFAHDIWDKTWRGGSLESNLAKVLDEMNAPPGCSNLNLKRVPLLSMWQPIWPNLPDGFKSISPNILFEIPIKYLKEVDGKGQVAEQKKKNWVNKQNHHEHLMWFSQSAYLRSLLKEKEIEIPMMDTQERMRHLYQMFGSQKSLV